MIPEYCISILSAAAAVHRFVVFVNCNVVFREGTTIGDVSDLAKDDVRQVSRVDSEETCPMTAATSLTTNLTLTR